MTFVSIGRFLLYRIALVREKRGSRSRPMVSGGPTGARDRFLAQRSFFRNVRKEKTVGMETHSKSTTPATAIPPREPKKSL